jgi:BirA family transcriptional regulator, biotin operon repressor / biotin---[acetyl-CoA-carboxylase] ligase
VIDGHWLVADRQTAGRGRLGRAWHDGAGNFMGSTALALRPRDPPPHSLSLVAGVAVYRAVEVFAPDRNDLKLKWPNDLLLGGAKLSGLLLERSDDHVVVGVGVNLASSPQLADRATTSLAGQDILVARDAFAAVLADCFDRAVEDWRTDWRGRILTAWAAHAHPQGTALTISDGPHAGVVGLFDGLDGDGALRLRRETGETLVIHAGEVRVIPEMG